MDELKDVFSNLVRVGTVRNVSGKKARVYFPSLGITSGWLYVLQRPGETVSVSSAAAHSHSIQDTYSGGGSCGSSGGHSHTASVSSWAPDIDDTVLCLFMPEFNPDGYVLGVIG